MEENAIIKSKLLWNIIER